MIDEFMREKQKRKIYKRSTNVGVLKNPDFFFFFFFWERERESVKYSSFKVFISFQHLVWRLIIYISKCIYLFLTAIRDFSNTPPTFCVFSAFHKIGQQEETEENFLPPPLSQSSKDFVKDSVELSFLVLVASSLSNISVSGIVNGSYYVKPGSVHTLEYTQ